MKKNLLDKIELKTLIESLAKQIASQEKSSDPFYFVGIHTRGIPLAHRLAKILKKDPNKIGFLDINLYRDDLSTVADMPILKETRIPFSIEDARILLIDDVLFTGRTVRSALNAIMDLGRPQQIKLLALVDRNTRELPIQPDFCGRMVEVKPNEVVAVKFEESDGVDEVIVQKK